MTKVREIAGWEGKLITLPKDKFPEDWNLPLNSEQDWFLDSLVSVKK